MSAVLTPQRAVQYSRSLPCRGTGIAHLRPPTCFPSPLYRHLLPAGQAPSLQPPAPGSCSTGVKTAAVPASTPLFDFPTHQLFPGLHPQLQFILDRLIEDILVPVLIAWVVLRVVDVVSNAAQKAQEQLEGTSSTTMLEEMLVLAPIAVRAPAQAVTLIVLFTHLARNLLWILDRWFHRFHEGTDSVFDNVLHGVCSLLVPFDRFMVKLYSVCVVAFVTWAIIRWKSLLLTYLLQQHAEGQKGALDSTQDLERLVLPLDGVSSWVMSAIGAITILHVAGINLQPLLALGGVSSLVVGLASQQLLTNTVLGFNFFLSRPFVAGDVVQFNGPGNMTVAGVVDKVAPMRVMLRTEDGAVVSIPNKVVSDMIIYNRTKEAGPGITDRVRLRQPLRLRIKVPHSSIDKLPDLRAALSAQLAAAGGLVTRKGEGLVLGKFTEAGVDLTAQGMLQQDYTSRGVQELLLALCTICRQHGATMVTL